MTTTDVEWDDDERITAWLNIPTRQFAPKGSLGASQSAPRLRRRCGWENKDRKKECYYGIDIDTFSLGSDNHGR